MLGVQEVVGSIPAAPIPLIFLLRFPREEFKLRISIIDAPFLQQTAKSVQVERAFFLPCIGTRFAFDACAMRTFDQVVSELKPIYRTKAKATFQEFEITTRCHLLPFFGETLIQSSGTLWRHYVAKQREINPERQLKNDRKILRIILGYAYEQRYIQNIPFLKLDAQDKRKKRFVTIVTEEMFSAVRLNAAKPWDLILDLLWCSGARFSEVLQLEWSEIKFDEGLIVLSPSKTKTRQGRSYPITKDCLDALISRKKRAKSHRYVFPNRLDANRPMLKGYKGWKKLFKGRDFYFRPHDLRHTFATRNIVNGIPIAVLAQLMGASAQILERVYLHSQSLDWGKFINFRGVKTGGTVVTPAPPITNPP